MFRVVSESVGGDVEEAAARRELGRACRATARGGARPVGRRGVAVQPEQSDRAADFGATCSATCWRRRRTRSCVVDEAYYEISGHSLAPVVLESPNGVLVRTFSKGYGLAGARVGYLVGPSEVTRAIESVRLPQNMTAFGIAAACRALADQAGLQERVAAIVAERERLEGELRARGWELVAVDGQFRARPPTGASRRRVAAWLQGGGLIVRSYPGHPRLNDWLRITVRSPEEDDRLLGRLDALRRALPVPAATFEAVPA